MRCFRKEGKQEFARYKELVENLVVGGDSVRQDMLDYMKKKGIIQSRSVLYVLATDKLNELGLSWEGSQASTKPELDKFLTEFISTRKPKA